MDVWPMTRTRVKVCGICTSADAEVAITAGADAIGMVFYSKSPPHVTPATARIIASAIPPFVSTVGLFVNSSQQHVRDVLSEVQLDLLQFHGDEDEAFCSSFKLPYIKAIRVKADTDFMQVFHDYASARG